MKLPEEDIELFYKLHPALLFYANQQLKVVSAVSTVKEFMGLPLEEKIKIRDALYAQIDLVDFFVKENPFDFSAEELKIVLSWKNLVRGTFYLFRYLKKYAIFLDTDSPPKAYGVLSLKDGFDEILGPYLPIMLETVLLPFKEQITYDGLMSSYRVTFGAGIRRDLNDAYQEAKSRFGIITSLPFSTEGMEQNDADRLRFYLRSERNREMYWEEMEELIDKDPSLLVLYHQEMGKTHARRYGKQLHEIGVTDAWFAIFETIIIASGPTRDEVERILQEILPIEKRKFVYIFQLKRK